jgi:Fic family protein
MDSKDFGPNSPGWLSEITSIPGVRYAFNPNPLPPDWDFPPGLWPLLLEANRQLMLLEGIGRTLPNPAILLRPLRDRDAILSSRMEGTYATPPAMLLFELDPRDPAADDGARQDYQEVANYAKALDLAVQSPQPLGLPVVKQLHAVLMNGVRGKDKEPGAFRNRPVFIGDKVSAPRFVPPPPERLQDFLEGLDDYLRRANTKYDPLVECFVVHYQFETIHPFLDGNGRVGRLLLTLMVRDRCGVTQPWLHMSEYFSRDKHAYVTFLKRVSTDGAWDEWIEYCLQGVVEQASSSIVRCDRLRQLRDEYLSRLTVRNSSLRLKEIVEGLFSAPMVAVADLPRRLGVSYPTAKADVKKLMDAGVLAEWPNHYPKTYYAPEIFAIAYEGLDGIDPS